MEKIDAEDAMKELTMTLIYLSRFSEKNRFNDANDYYAWKGYDFNILNELDVNDFIRQGNPPSGTKSVYIIDSGIDYAKEMIEKYGIEDWKK